MHGLQPGRLAEHLAGQLGLALDEDIARPPNADLIECLLIAAQRGLQALFLFVAIYDEAVVTSMDLQIIVRILRVQAGLG